MPSGQALGQNHPFGLSMSSFSPDDGYSQHSHNQSQSQAMMQSPYRWSESLSLDPAPSSVVNHSTGGDVASPVRFKERALAHAHNTYAELLTYLNHTKKSYHGRSISGIRPSSKMVVFPKPPKQPASGLSPRQHKASHSSSQHLASYSQTSSRSVAYASRLAESAASGSLPMTACHEEGWQPSSRDLPEPALQNTPTQPSLTEYIAWATTCPLRCRMQRLRWKCSLICANRAGGNGWTECYSGLPALRP